jgi:hypothetical protein
MWSDDQIKQMPIASVVTAAMKDPKLWPRVAQLRPDADEILWRVAEREDTRAARLIKQIDMDRFKKAITKKGQILARLHTQTPEMVQLALSINPDYVKFVRNRTPAQHATILKLLKKNPAVIKTIHEPTAEQVQLAVKLSGWLWDWALKNHPKAFTQDQIAQYVIITAKNYDIDDEILDWVKTSYPDVLTNPQVFEAVAAQLPEWLWANQKLSDADVVKIILAQSRPDGWGEEWIERQAQPILRRLQQVDKSLIDDIFIKHVTRVAPYLLAALPDAVSKEQLLKLVRQSPHLLNYWPDPDADMVYVALKHDRDEQLEMNFEEAKYDPAWLRLIEQDPEFILRRTQANDKLVRAAATHKDLGGYEAGWILRHFNPSAANQVILLKRHPRWINVVSKPSLAAQMAAVNADPDAYNLIKPKDRHPAVKAYITAYRKEMRKPE